MGARILPFRPLAKQFPKREATARRVLRRQGHLRLMENGQIESARRDFRRDLTALWQQEGKRLSGRQFVRLRRQDDPDPAA